MTGVIVNEDLLVKNDQLIETQHEKLESQSALLENQEARFQELQSQVNRVQDLEQHVARVKELEQEVSRVRQLESLVTRLLNGNKVAPSSAAASFEEVQPEQPQQHGVLKNKGELSPIRKKKTTMTMSKLTTNAAAPELSPTKPKKTITLSESTHFREAAKEQYQKTTTAKATEGWAEAVPEKAFNETGLLRSPGNLPTRMSVRNMSARNMSARNMGAAAAKQFDDEDEEGYGEEDAECGLSEDCYSLLYIAPIMSATFTFSMLVFAFQFTMMILVLVDQISGDRENPLNIPPAVSPPVLGAQGLCMLLAVAVQQDMIHAITTFHAGHSDELTRDAPAATYSKFVLANALQFLIGTLQLVNTFILVMQSSTVIDVFLNFAGLEFISLIDDIGFSLGQNGFITKTVQRMCDAALELKQPKAKDLMFRRVCYIISYMGMMVGYAIIVLQQRRGDFLCNKIFVQFGDAFRAEYSGFSGEYVKMEQSTIAGRPYYLEVKTLDQKKKSVLAYCAEEESWTHSTFDTRIEEGPMPCRWGAKSPGTTTTYDVTETSDWVVYSEDTNVIYPMTIFYLSCNDCEGGRYGTCNEQHGTCVDNTCECFEDRYGLNCVFEKPCEWLVSDARLDEFSEDVEGFRYANDYELLRDDKGEVVFNQGHPIYVHDYYGDFTFLDFIFFTGRRWVLSDKQKLMAFSAGNFTVSDVVEWFDKFHPVFTKYTYSFATGPMDVGTPSYSGTPEALEWWRILNVNRAQEQHEVVERGLPVGTSLLCGLCDEAVNPCLNGHDCNNLFGNCTCREGYSGALCESTAACNMDSLPCYGNGTCDETSGECQCPDSATLFYGKFCEVLDRRDDPLPTPECGCAQVNQKDYRGTIHTTTSGLECQPWDALEPHEHVNTPDEHPDAGLESNYCRNPTNDENGAWCYTTDPDVRQESCDVPVCPASSCR